jgi:hypothetical protein
MKNRAPIEITEIISGERFEKLCDYSFDIGNYVNGDHGRPKYNGKDTDLITTEIRDINYLKAKVLFVYGHDLPIFMENLHRITNPLKIVSHNSDLGIKESYKSGITDTIIEWYGQNNHIQHERVFSLPIGIANSKYAHGNLPLLVEVMCNNTKTQLVYKNFDISTNIRERSIVDAITNKHNIHMAQKTNIHNYWNQLSNSIFTISPHGNGIDCHRIWECLYFGTVPIVENHPALEHFKHLPILFIDNWDTVTLDFLTKNVNNWDKNYDLDMLKLSYWKTRIRG